MFPQPLRRTRAKPDERSQAEIAGDNQREGRVYGSAAKNSPIVAIDIVATSMPCNSSQIGPKALVADSKFAWFGRRHLSS